MRATGIYAAIHLAGTAALLWLGYTWLGLGEGRALALVESFAVGLAFLCLTCWLYGAAFPFFAKRRISAAFGIALRTLPALIAAAILMVALYWVVGWLGAYLVQHLGFHMASWMTLNFRRPVRPYTVQHTIETIFWVIRWIVLPLLLLPMVAAIALRGWRGFSAIGAGCCRRLYWLKAPILVLMAVWVPCKLLTWVPHMKSFPMEMTSFVARVAAAYLLFVAGWLALAFVTSGGSPVRTQPSTVPSP
jgi:hypothetical protein